MQVQHLRLLATAGALPALLFAVSGCAPVPSSRALGLHDTHIIEGLPMPEYRNAWYGIPLDNFTSNPVEIKSMHLIDASNLNVGKPFVIDITDSDYIDWYAPPGTKQMRKEVAHRVPLAGFEIPPHTHRRYEAIVLATALDPDVAASTTGGRIRYETAGHSAEETWLEQASLTVSG